MRLSVVIPTYCRVNDLKRCLKAVQLQTRLPDEIIVIIRDTDTDTSEFVGELNFIKTVCVSISGAVAAYNAGLEASTGDIVAFIDDDAEPHIDWAEKLALHYCTDSTIGGLGGRDWIYRQDILRSEIKNPKTIGKLTWFGKIIGNHHLGEGLPREVDILKGANMSFRKIAIENLKFDERLRGKGAQVHLELGICLKLKKAGWKLIYDPTVAVNHYPGQRFDEDQRSTFNEIAFLNRVHNESLILLENLSLVGKLAFWIWFSLIGTSNNFGLIQWMRFLPSDRAIASNKLFLSFKGRLMGWETSQESPQNSLALTRKNIYKS